MASFRYTQFVVAEALTAAIRSKGFNTTETNIPPGSTFDAVCDTISKASGCQLYVMDRVRGGNYVYNSNSQETAPVSIERTSHAFVVLDGVPVDVHFVQYESASTTDLEYDLEEAEESETDRNEESMDPDFDSSGWYYDSVDDDFKSLKSMRPNVKYTSRDQYDCAATAESFDLFLKCPHDTTSRFVVGYSTTGKIVFSESVLFTRKLGDSTSLLKIPNGMGICMLTGVSDVLLLDKMHLPVAAYKLHEELYAFISGINRRGITGVIGNPLVQTTEDAIEFDIDSKYRNIQPSSVEEGECVYSFEAQDKGKIPQFGTLNYMVSRGGLFKNLLHTPASNVCFSLESLEQTVIVLDRHLPRDRSIIYHTNEAFVNFLYVVGYPHEKPQYEDLPSAFKVYQNVKAINSNLVTNQGYLEIDMRPFQTITNTAHNTLTIIDWKEKNTGLRYTIQ